MADEMGVECLASHVSGAFKKFSLCSAGKHSCEWHLSSKQRNSLVWSRKVLYRRKPLRLLVLYKNFDSEMQLNFTFRLKSIMVLL